MAKRDLGIRVNPGQMNCPVIIEDYVLKKEGISKEQVWESISCSEIYAQWIGAHGSEAIIAAQSLAKDRATLRIRYNPKVTTRCRVIKDNDRQNPYNIVSVDDVRNRHQYMELKIERNEKG